MRTGNHHQHYDKSQWQASEKSYELFTYPPLFLSPYSVVYCNINCAIILLFSYCKIYAFLCLFCLQANFPIVMESFRVWLLSKNQLVDLFCVCYAEDFLCIVSFKLVSWQFMCLRKKDINNNNFSSEYWKLVMVLEVFYTHRLMRYLAQRKNVLECAKMWMLQKTLRKI